jgi:hypothetical protein
MEFELHLNFSSSDQEVVKEKMVDNYSVMVYYINVAEINTTH